MYNIVGIVAMLTSLSLVVYAVSDGGLAERAGLILTLLLTTVAFKFVIADTIPNISYSTQLDVYMFINMLYLFLTTIICTAVSLLDKFFPSSMAVVDNEEGLKTSRWNMGGFISSLVIYILLNALWIYRVTNRKSEEGIVGPPRPVKLVPGKNWYCFMFSNPSFLPEPETW